MCSKLLKHTPEESQGRFYHASERAFNAVIAFYGKTLRWVLGWQVATLLVAAATLGLTIFLFFVIPKGFFPDSGYGRDPGGLRSGPVGVFSGNVAPAAAVDQDHSARSGRRQSVLLYRNRWDQYHLE